jgi:hypothetical protein
VLLRPCLSLLLLFSAGESLARPASPLAAATDGSERIDDPEDRGPLAAPRPDVPTEPRTTWRARGSLRLALDPIHERSWPGGNVSYREDVMELLAQTSAQIEHELRPWLRLQLAGRLWYRLTARRPEQRDASYTLFNGSVHRSDFDAELLESHVAISRGWLDLRAGMLSTVFGAADLVNPNDLLTARDLRAGPPLDPEASRLPVPMVRGEATVRGFHLALCWMPIFVPHRVDLFGSDFALLGPIAPTPLQWIGALADGLFDDSITALLQEGLLQTRRPRPFADSSIAARVSRRVGAWDLALQYAWIHERLPIFRLRRDFVLAALPLVASPAGPSFEQRQQVAELLTKSTFPLEGIFRRQHQAGISASGSLWKLAVSFDLAYLSREAVNLGGVFPLADDGDGWLSTAVDSQALAYTIGVSYLRGEELLILVEGWHRVYLDLAREEEARRPELLLGGPHLAGAALLARYSFRRLRLTLQMLAHADLVNRSFLVAPRVSYRRGDHLGLMLGADLFAGSTASLGGRLQQNNQLYFAIEGYL